MVGDERKSLYLLVMRQLLLQCLYAVHHHLVHLGIGAKVLAVLECDAVILGPFLYEAELGHDECRHELALVGYHYHLVDELVNEQQRLYHLRSDILAVGCLEEVLDAIGKEQLAVLDVSGIARAEESVFGEGFLVDSLTLVVARRDGGTLEQYLVVVAYLHLQSVDRTTYRTDGERHVLAVATNGGKTLCKSIAHYHINAYRMDEALYCWRNGSSGCREDMCVLQSYLLAHQTQNHLVEELILHGQQRRRTLAAALAVDVVAAAYLKCMTEEALLGNARTVYLVKHCLINLLPESWHARHTCRMCLAH